MYTKAFKVKANFVRTWIVKGKSYNPNMNIFLDSPQTWQFPLSLHDFGQVCGRIKSPKILITISHQMGMIYQSTRCKAPSRLFSLYSMRPITIFVLLYRECMKQKLQTKVFLNYWEQINIFIFLSMLLQMLIKTTISPTLFTTCLICDEIQLQFKLCALFNNSHNFYSLLIIYRLLIIYSVQFTYNSYNS